MENEQGHPQASRPVPPAEGERSAASRREHAFTSLLELGRELTFSRDLFETVDLLLFNLMGQMGCGRSALWLFAGDDRSSPVLVRCHGFKRDLVGAIGLACNPAIHRHLRAAPAPVLSAELRDSLEAHELALLTQAQISVIAPLTTRGELLGWLTLGRKVNGAGYEASDVEMLETSLGMVAASLHNTILFKHLFESNRRLRATNEQLQEMDRLKNDFLSNVNHELRTPVTVVAASLECLLDQLPAGAPTTGLIEGALKKSKELQHIIENLLMFSEMQNASLEMNVAAGDVAGLLDAFANDRRPGVTADLRAFDYEADADLPAALFDGARLRLILGELVDNAVKFTPRGSRLQLRADRMSEGDTEWVRIELEDDGPGIPPERMRRLFHMFEQGDGSSVRTAGGLGIGLTFARELAQRMGGDLRARSALGKGAVFTVLLPLAAGMRAAA